MDGQPYERMVQFLKLFIYVTSFTQVSKVEAVESWTSEMVIP